MTADVPFSRPRYPPSVPGDAQRAPHELMFSPGMSRDEREWKLVWIRIGGAWRSGILTVWRRPPNSAVWVAHVRWGEDQSGEQCWGWFIYDSATIRPVPEPPADSALTGQSPVATGERP